MVIQKGLAYQAIEWTVHGWCRWNGGTSNICSNEWGCRVLYRKIMNHIIYLATLIEYTSGLILYGEHTHICIIIYKFVLVKSRVKKEDER